MVKLGKKPQWRPLLPFRKGQKVEVRLDADGFHGAWFEATVTRTMNKTRRHKIVYESLLSEDDTPLAEIVSWDQVRPRPPSTICGSFSGSQPFQLHQQVEAYHNDGWWAGYVSEVIDEGRWCVSFPCSGEVVEFGKEELRARYEWNSRNWVAPTTAAAVVPDSMEAIITREKDAEVKDLNSVQETSEGQLIEEEILLSKMISNKLSCKKSRKDHVEIVTEGELEKIEQICSTDLCLETSNDFELLLKESNQEHKKQNKKRKNKTFSLIRCRSRRRISDNFEFNRSNTKSGNNGDSDVELIEETTTQKRSDRHIASQSDQEGNVALNEHLLGQSKEKQTKGFAGFKSTRLEELLDAAKEIDRGGNVYFDVNNDHESDNNVLNISITSDVLPDCLQLEGETKSSRNVLEVTHSQENCCKTPLTSLPLSETTRNSKDLKFQKFYSPNMALNNRKEFIQEVKLPFTKTSPIWEFIESMKLYGTMLKQPHLSPLEQYREDFREGMAISMMINFDKVVKSIYQLGTSDPLATFDQKQKDLLYFESHGFDVSDIRDYLKSLLLMRDEKLKRIAELQAQISDRQNELAELNRKKEALDKSLDELSRDLTTLGETQESMFLLSEKSGSEIFKLQEEMGISQEQACALAEV